MNTGTLRAATACILIGACAPAAASAEGIRASDVQRPWLDRSSAKTAAPGARTSSRSQFGQGEQAPSEQRGLPPARENFDVISKFETAAPYANTQNGQIADVAVHKGTAYLMGWDDAECRAGGVHVVDIKDPATPKGLGFVPAAQGVYHGEGAHAIAVSTPQFQGDILAVNNEPYSSSTCATPGITGGGFDLLDVSDPANPKTLVQLAGDRSGEGSLTQDPTAQPNSYHSVFMWQDGPRAYLVGVDNAELTDVDIYDITDPRNPELITDLDLAERFPQIIGKLANGDTILHHDNVVKRINGRMTMLADYWDAGYVQLDVTDPSSPQLITDTNFDFADPLTGFEVPEGNAHQGEYSADNQFLLAADEDFAPYRAGAFSITSGPQAREYPAQEVGGGLSAASLPDQTLNGPTVYGGYGCDASDPVPLRSAYDLTVGANEEAILVLQRGPGATQQNADDPEGDPLPDDPENPEEACFPGEKAANADAAGWDAVLLVNRHVDGPENDRASCGSGGYPEGARIVTLCTTHEAYHRMFATAPDYSIPYVAANEPDLGLEGERVQGLSEFDAWGYTHLYDAKTSEELDAYAIPEALDPRFAFDFGDLSVHEFATDPDTNLAYASYYAGGMRAFQFSREGGLQETGKFIDPEGSNFWGVEQFTGADGKRYVAGSDRDFGLVILRYTGPGSENTGRKAATPATPAVPGVSPATRATPAAAARNRDSTFKLSKRGFLRNRFTVTYTTKGPGISSTELTAVIAGKRTRIARRAVVHGAAGAKTYTVRLTAGESARLRRAIRRSSAKRVTGTIRAAFTARGENGGKVQRSALTLR